MKKTLCDVQTKRKHSIALSPLVFTLTLAFLWLTFTGHAQNFQQTDTQTADVFNMDDEFGTSVSISGNYAVVGAPEHDEDVSGGNNISNAGAVYIFKNDGAGNWAFHQKIVSPARNISDQFGGSVSIAGDYIIVGANLADSNPATNLNSNEGAAYVFKRNTGSDQWVILGAPLVAPNVANADQFGISVAITNTGDAFVGANAEDEDASDGDFKDGAGSAYFYRWDGTNWNMKQKIVASDREQFESFGSSLAVSGNFLVIGAQAEDVSTIGDNFGAAYVYQFNSSTEQWDEFTKLTAPTADRSTSDAFGVSVAIDGDWIVVGANFDDEKDDTGTDGSPLDNAGAAYVFKYDGTSWNYTKKLVAGVRAAADNFGVRVSISGENILISAQAEDEDENEDNTINNAGSAYIFHLTDGDNWVRAKKITSSTRETNALFGSQVAIDGDYLIVGARRKDISSSTDAGEVYFYKNGTTFNPGLAFNGSDSYIVLPTVNEFKFDVTTAFTIEAWVKFSGGTLADGQYQSIVTKGNEAWRLRFKGTADPVLLSFDYNGTNEVNSSGTPDFKLGGWHHVAVVFDGSTTTKTVTMYIDGTVNASQVFSSDMIPNNDPVWVGNNFDDNSVLNGSIDDLRIWKRTKDATEIAAAKDCQLTGSEPCLLAYLDFNDGFPNGENTGLTQVKDVSDNNNWFLLNFDLNDLSSNFTDADPTLSRAGTCSNAINLPVMTILGNGANIKNNGIDFSMDNDTQLGNINIGTSVTRTYTIKNTGLLDLNLLNGPNFVTNTGSSDFTITQQPTVSTLAPNAETSFTIQFTPTIEDAPVGTFSINSNDCNGVFFVNVTGAGVTVPEINVQDDATPANSIDSGDNFDLGTQAINGSPILRTFTIQNTNSGTLNLTGTAPNFITLTGSSDFSIASQPTSSTIAGNSSTTFQVRFNTNTVGTQTAVLTIANDDADEDIYTINLSTEGVAPEINLVDPLNNNIETGNTVNFGTVTVGSSTINQTFTIQNTASIATLNLKNSAPNLVAITGDNAFSITSQPNDIIAAQTSTTFQVSFDPSAVGSYSAQISIANDDPDEDPYIVNFTAEVNPPLSPEITVSYNGSNLNSGDTLAVDTTAALNTRSTMITILNEGTAALNLEADVPFVLSGTNASEFAIDASATTNPVAINANTTVTVNLTPTSLGKKTATLTINNDDANEGAFIVHLKSFAVAPPTQPAEVTVQPTDPPADANPTTPNAVNVSWTPPDDLDNVIGYRIKRSDGNTDNFNLIAEVDINTTTYLDLNLVEGVQYYYRVFSYNQFGESDPGPLSSLIYVGVEETQRFAKQTLVFPNPATSKTNIRFPQIAAQQVILNLYNSSGQLLKTSTQKLTKQAIVYDMEDLANGRYLLQIQIADHTIYKQIIKQ